MGTGVSWFDDHPEMKIEIPRVETPYHLAEGASLDAVSDEDVGEITKALRTIGQELADVSFAMTLSTADDQSDETIASLGLDPGTAVWVGEVGNTYAVNGDPLVSSHWERLLDIAREEHAQLWTDAETRAGTSAQAALDAYLTTKSNGYRWVDSLGGEYPTSEEHISAETLVETALERHKDWDAAAVWAVARSAFGAEREGEIPWSVGGGETQVFAQRIRHN
jgi:hypothetical protein